MRRFSCWMVMAGLLWGIPALGEVARAAEDQTAPPTRSQQSTGATPVRPKAPPAPQVLIEAVILRLDSYQAPAVTSPASLLKQVLGAKASLKVLTDAANAQADAETHHVQLVLSFIPDSVVASFDRDIEKVAMMTTIARPRMLILDKQRGEIHLTGTQLRLRPFVTTGNAIRLELGVESQAAGTPRSLSSDVIMPDGSTIVLGGIRGVAPSAEEARSDQATPPKDLMITVKARVWRPEGSLRAQ